MDILAMQPQFAYALILGYCLGYGFKVFRRTTESI
jgi:hypothetical protein